MLLMILAAVAGALVLAAALWFGLAFAMRRPAAMRVMVRIAPLRWLMVRMTRFGMRAARKRAERDGTLPTGRPVSDLEIALATSDTPEARRARAMLARMTPRQRAEVSRRTMGADGLSGLLGEGMPSADDTEALGRDARRRGAGLDGSAGRESARAQQQRKAVAKRRAARKRARR